MLLDLVPPRGYAPDFLSPVAGGSDPKDGIETVLDTPRLRIAEDLDRRFGGQQRPSWTGGLVRKDGAIMRALGKSMRSYFDTAIRPYWSYISMAAEDKSTAIRNTARGPVGQILRLKDRPADRTAIRTVIDLPYSTDQELHLRGRGLTLVPAFFCTGHPVTFREPALPPVLLYPIDHEPISFLTRAARGTGPTEEVLRRLFGGTRAAVLRALSDRVHTTGGIARSLGISIASASEHASLLRAAGLVASERCGNTVQHWLTPLGLEFLGQTS
jgi:DNA-binding transcriptional ArsR family regulator